MKGHRIEYSDAELFWIHDNHKRPRREAHAEFVDLWNRPDVSLSNFTSLCKRKGWMTGRTGCFKKGQVPPNKGQKGYCAPGSEKGWFKKGQRRGVAVELYKPIGTERVSKDGDKANTAPDNWEAIPRALLPRLSGGRWYRGYDTLEPELRQTALAIAKLEHKARTMDD